MIVENRRYSKLTAAAFRTDHGQSFHNPHKGRVALALYRDARVRERVWVGMVLFARSIKPQERSRLWLRRARVLCKFNCAKERYPVCVETVREGMAVDTERLGAGRCARTSLRE